MIDRTAWKKNQYTLGSYSYIPVGAHIEDIDRLSEPVVNQQGKVSQCPLSTRNGDVINIQCPVVHVSCVWVT